MAKKVPNCKSKIFAIEMWRIRLIRYDSFYTLPELTNSSIQKS